VARPLTDEEAAAVAGKPVGKLRQTLGAAQGDDYSMDDLTVLSQQTDPFRLDTPARHEWGAWLALQASELGLGDRKIHLRGLHYMLVSGRVKKPDGTSYENNDADWLWMSEKAAKAARWLGYLPFEQIIDQRNAPPIVRPFERDELEPYLSVGVEVEIPGAADLKPSVGIAGFEGRQRHKLVLWGEKSSLEEVLAPLAEAHEADLYLPTGEISDTLLYRMAAEGHEDGRRMVVLIFADCDPGGWQMAISIARKLQAFKALEFSELDFEVRRVALVPEQVKEYGLPESPLKDTEKRADDWEEKMGVEQTEIDALAALQPDLLDQIARAGIAPFFDYSLADRVGAARREWVAEARRVVEEQLDGARLEHIRRDAAEKLAELETEIDAINEAMHMEVGDEYDWPPAVIPEPEPGDAPADAPLIDSGRPFAEQSLKLKRSKAYEDQ
jgi:hypothetical protein